VGAGAASTAAGGSSWTELRPYCGRVPHGMGAFDLVIAVAATVILFLYGLQSFSREVQLLGRERLHGALERFTRNRLAGFALGALFTAVVQSNSAVSAPVKESPLLVARARANARDVDPASGSAGLRFPGPG
jgi:hypothetical protein